MRIKIREEMMGRRGMGERNKKKNSPPSSKRSRNENPSRIVKSAQSGTPLSSSHETFPNQIFQNFTRTVLFYFI
jgi:hypothetical protein